ARFALDRPVASLTFLDPVSPYGYGTLAFPDAAGTGGGGTNPEVVARLRAGDTTADSPFTARSVFRAFYVAPGFAEPREDLLVDEILKTHVVDLDPKPPVLWTHGAVDLVVADGSPLELGTLGASGAVPGWPGADVYPPQPMVTQIRAVLDRYAAAGGSVRVEIIEGAGHGPHLDAAPRWLAIFREFLATIG